MTVEIVQSDEEKEPSETTTQANLRKKKAEDKRIRKEFR